MFKLIKLSNEQNVVIHQIKKKDHLLKVKIYSQSNQKIKLKRYENSKKKLIILSYFSV